MYHKIPKRDKGLGYKLPNDSKPPKIRNFFASNIFFLSFPDSYYISTNIRIQ